MKNTKSRRRSWIIASLIRSIASRITRRARRRLRVMSWVVWGRLCRCCCLRRSAIIWIVYWSSRNCHWRFTRRFCRRRIRKSCIRTQRSVYPQKERYSRYRRTWSSNLPASASSRSPPTPSSYSSGTRTCCRPPRSTSNKWSTKSATKRRLSRKCVWAIWTVTCQTAHSQTPTRWPGATVFNNSGSWCNSRLTCPRKASPLFNPASLCKTWSKLPVEGPQQK